jgi:hypothetical protein
MEYLYLSHVKGVNEHVLELNWIEAFIWNAWLNQTWMQYFLNGVLLFSDLQSVKSSYLMN